MQTRATRSVLRHIIALLAQSTVILGFISNLLLVGDRGSLAYASITQTEVFHTINACVKDHILLERFPNHRVSQSATVGLKRKRLECHPRASCCYHAHYSFPANSLGTPFRHYIRTACYSKTYRLVYKPFCLRDELLLRIIDSLYSERELRFISRR